MFGVLKMVAWLVKDAALFPVAEFSIVWFVELDFALVDGDASSEFDEDGPTLESALAVDVPVCALLLFDANDVVVTVICCELNISV